MIVSIMLDWLQPIHHQMRQPTRALGHPLIQLGEGGGQSGDNSITEGSPTKRPTAFKMPNLSLNSMLGILLSSLQPFVVSIPRHSTKTTSHSHFMASNLPHDKFLSSQLASKWSVEVHWEDGSHTWEPLNVRSHEPGDMFFHCLKFQIKFVQKWGAIKVNLEIVDFFIVSALPTISVL